VMTASVCVSVSLRACLSVRQDISGTPSAIFTKFFMRVAYVRGSVPFRGMLMIGRIAYRPEGGDGSAQRGRSVIYDCLVERSTL